MSNTSAGAKKGAETRNQVKKFGRVAIRVQYAGGGEVRIEAPGCPTQAKAGAFLRWAAWMLDGEEKRTEVNMKCDGQDDPAPATVVTEGQRTI